MSTTDPASKTSTGRNALRESYFPTRTTFEGMTQRQFEDWVTNVRELVSRANEMTIAEQAKEDEKTSTFSRLLGRSTEYATWLEERLSEGQEWDDYLTALDQAAMEATDETAKNETEVIDKEESKLLLARQKEMHDFLFGPESVFRGGEVSQAGETETGRGSTGASLPSPGNVRPAKKEQ